MISLTDGDEEMRLDLSLVPSGLALTVYLAPDEIHQLVEALTEEKTDG